VGAAFDISKTKKIEQELQLALEKEKELSELKTRFISMASHEFRTPLSTVLSSSYLIEKYSTTADQQKREKHLQRIVSSVNMLTDILNDFLSVGKMEEGKIQLRLSQFNIRDLVISIAEEMKNNLKKKQKINYHHQGDQIVLLDASLLKHIVMNLVSNASKFSPEGKPIDITTVSHNGQLIFSIRDYGMGISKEDQQHLMERFFRGTNATNIQGTGLGLHIVSKYAELMNGVVVCNSELEKGTEFILTFTKSPLT
jgi:signal transduction histidine kinase